MPRIDTRLTYDQFLALGNMLSEINQRLLRHYTPSAVVKIQHWVNERVGGMNPVLLLASNNLNLLHKEILEDPDYARYFTELTFLFFTIAALQDNWVHALANNLSDGLLIDGDDPRLNLIPAPISYTLPGTLMRATGPQNWFLRQIWSAWQTLRYGRAPATLAQLLINNKIVMLLLLIRLYQEPANPKQPPIAA